MDVMGMKKIGIEKEKEIVNDKTHRNRFETLGEEIGKGNEGMGRRLRNGISSPVLQPRPIRLEFIRVDRSQ